MELGTSAPSGSSPKSASATWYSTTTKIASGTHLARRCAHSTIAPLRERREPQHDSPHPCASQ
eukprot:3848568-Prymnesium_polylepis.2